MQNNPRYSQINPQINTLDFYKNYTVKLQALALAKHMAKGQSAIRNKKGIESKNKKNKKQKRRNNSQPKMKYLSPKRKPQSDRLNIYTASRCVMIAGEEGDEEDLSLVIESTGLGRICKKDTRV